MVFVNTLFDAWPRSATSHSFVPQWRPPFISKLAAEIVCHLNGLALENGKAKYVTAVSQSDVADGWRDRRHDGGCVIDVQTNEIIAMVYRCHTHRVSIATNCGCLIQVRPLWIHRSRDRQVCTVAFCPGYLRGLSFHGDFAIVGLSKSRENKTFSGLALDQNLQSGDAEARCGLQVIDLNSGDVVHWIRIERSGNGALRRSGSGERRTAQPRI